MRHLRLVTGILFLAMAAGLLIGGFHWTINRIYVPQGTSLILRYKGPLIIGNPASAKPGHFAQDDEIGVREKLLGPGRHFYCPIWWERTLVDDVVVKPGEVAIVTSKLGEPLPVNEFLVDGDIEGTNRARHQGVLRKVYGPGRYRVNTYGFVLRTIKTQIDDVGLQKKYSGWVDIPSGFVGVLTLLAANPQQQRKAGIQDNVLPPGIYFMNPREAQVDIVEIGFRETSMEVEKQMDRAGNIVVDESNEPLAMPKSGIGFPSSDAFHIQIDFTAIWGVMPKEAPQVVRTFGSINQAEQKVVIPQAESICRNNGSKMGAVQLLVGETRQQFQTNVTDEFGKVLKEKHITLLYGLVRHVYIPQEVRVPIQNGYIAEEMTLTREQEQKTARTEALLREAERKVELEGERVRVETEKKVANTTAEGEKKAKETDAETKQMVAEIDRKIAELDAQKTVKLGEAKAQADLLQQEAKAQKFELAIKAFGDPAAYNKWEFANGLPESIDLRLLYAGEGTLWTDLKNVMPTLQIQPPIKPADKPAETKVAK